MLQTVRQVLALSLGLLTLGAALALRIVPKRKKVSGTSPFMSAVTKEDRPMKRWETDGFRET